MNAILLMLATYLAAMSSQYGSNIQVSDDVWISFKLDHAKQYPSVAEEALRRQVFAYNKHEIETFNNNNLEASFKLGINKFSDMVDQEFGHVKKNSNMANHGFKSVASPTNSLTSIPKEVDWRKEGVISEVKDQGAHCQADYAFVTTDSIEAQMKIRHKANGSSSANMVPLSTQFVIDCSTKALLNDGCHFGACFTSYAFVEEYGILAEKDYAPYSGAIGDCVYDKSKILFKGKGYDEVCDDEQKLAEYVAEKGPMAAIIDETKLFRNYKSGIFDDPTCSNGTEGNREVLVVGYGTTDKSQDYWIVKNSWGKSWGEDGYMRMSRNKKNQCGISRMAFLALI